MKKKSKILHLKQILLMTDEFNPISTNQIISQLSQQGIEANRKTLGNDIKLLTEEGMDIVSVRSSQNLYYVGMREFEGPEVKLLVDAIESSKVLTYKKSKVLIEKLLRQISITEAEMIKQECTLEERIKPSNEEIYYSIDTIQNAIFKNHAVMFEYKDFNANKVLVHKHNGEVYCFSPYNLIWYGDYYYAVGYSHKHKDFGCFRVDRMSHTLESKELFIDRRKEYNQINYPKQCFSMFSGEKKNIRLLCDNELMKVVIDRFGEELRPEKFDDKQFQINVEVMLAPTFYGWLFQFTNQVKLLAPQSVVEEYEMYLQKTINIYKECDA